MDQSAFRTIVRHQWKLLIRDHRLILVSVALLLASVTALTTGVARNERLRLERDAAMNADARVWASQGKVNPHNAAHFGRYVVRPVPVLSAFDPGLLEELGTVQRLEAHRQSPASARPRDSGTALNRFASFNAASALQVMAPLLVILLAFGTFSGERARTLLQQELATGVEPRTLLLARLCALSGVVGLIIVAFLAAGVVVLLSAEGSAASLLLRLLLALLGYGIYLATFLAIALGVSALFRSARSALTALLACWIMIVLLVPASTPAIVTAVYPTPSGPQLQGEISAQINGELDGDRPREQRPERLRQLILEKYGVQSLEELPVNYTGAMLEHSEDLSSRAYQEHYDDLYGVYRRQAALKRALALLSPLLPLKQWSAALAETDFAAHHRFLTESERYRYAFVQRLNRDILLHRPRQGERYLADVASLTADLDRFDFSSTSVGRTWQEQWIDLAILIVWLAAAICFASWCAGRLRSRS